MRSPLKRGFTLLELLTVISIVALLAAMLFPVFETAREKARQSVCASNLRQLYLATALYSSDYDEFYPPGSTGWEEAVWGRGAAASPRKQPDLTILLRPYIKADGVWRCPSDTGFGWINPVYEDPCADDCLLGPSPDAFSRYGSSYTYRMGSGVRRCFFGGECFTEFRLDGDIGPIIPASETGVYRDIYGSWHGGSGSEGLPAKRWNIIMADGHVAFQSFPYINRTWTAGPPP